MKQAEKHNPTIADTVIIVIAVIFGKGNYISVNLNLNAEIRNESNNLPKLTQENQTSRKMVNRTNALFSAFVSQSNFRDRGLR